MLPYYMIPRDTVSIVLFHNRVRTGLVTRQVCFDPVVDLLAPDLTFCSTLFVLPKLGPSKELSMFLVTDCYDVVL